MFEVLLNATLVIVNVYTLKRHAILYPHTVKRILYFIKESYDGVLALIN
jgi:hypothetical protein